MLPYLDGRFDQTRHRHLDGPSQPVRPGFAVATRDTTRIGAYRTPSMNFARRASRSTDSPRR